MNWAEVHVLEGLGNTDKRIVEGMVRILVTEMFDHGNNQLSIA